MVTNSMSELIEVRCPFQKVRNNGTISMCNRLIIRVSAGSSGEAYCRSCSLEFDFEVDSQSNYKPKVIVKK